MLSIISMVLCRNWESIDVTLAILKLTIFASISSTMLLMKISVLAIATEYSKDMLYPVILESK